MGRTPPPDIRRALRREVGFGCPIPNCGSPYLEYHHFDPPWREQQHMNPHGIIPLCVLHHKQADRRAWTKSQLHAFKRRASRSRASVRGRWEWMRERVLGEVGGNFVYNTPILLYCARQPVIWFTRAQEGYLRVNLRMPRTASTADLVMQDNDWMVAVSAGVKDIECSPGGDRLAVKYRNGDALAIEFRELQSAAGLAPTDPNLKAIFAQVGFPQLNTLDYPLLRVDFQMTVQALDINIDRHSIRLAPGHQLIGNIVLGAQIGFAIGDAPYGGGAAIHIARS